MPSSIRVVERWGNDWVRAVGISVWRSLDQILNGDVGVDDSQSWREVEMEGLIGLVCRDGLPIRKVMETRTIELAMEEGRRLGYKEGIRQVSRSSDDPSQKHQPICHYRTTSLRSTRDH